MRRSLLLRGLVAVGLCSALAACSSSGSPRHSDSTDRSGASSSAATTYRTVVQLTPTFVGTLNQFKIEPDATSPATFTNGTTLTFPVSATSLVAGAAGSHPPYTGSVHHSGGLKLSAQGLAVALDDVVITLGTDSTVAGTIELNGKSFGGSATTLFDIDTAAMTASTSGDTTTLSGGKLYVDATAASELNLAFGLSGSAAIPTTHFGLEVGTVTTTVKR